MERAGKTQVGNQIQGSSSVRKGNTQVASPLRPFGSPRGEAPSEMKVNQIKSTLIAAYRIENSSSPNISSKPQIVPKVFHTRSSI